MIDGVFSTIIVVKRWLLRKSSGCGDRQVPHHAHHAQKATGLLPLLCDLFHVCHLRHLAFLAGQHLVLVDALEEAVALQNAMLNLFHLFDHHDLVHHSPMDRFVAHVTSKIAEAWCWPKIALSRRNPILGSKGHQLPPKPGKSSVSHYNKDVCLNLLPCWLGFVDWVGAPLHLNSLFGVGHFCGPCAVFVPVLSSSDS